MNKSKGIGGVGGQNPAAIPADAERLAQIEARLAAATPGRWEATVVEEKTQSADWGRDDESEEWRGKPRSNARFAALVRLDAVQGEARVNILPITHLQLGYQANAELIANAPADLAWLIARLRDVLGHRPTVRRVVTDGVYHYKAEGGVLYWHGEHTGWYSFDNPFAIPPCVTAERVALWADLLANPTEEGTTPEATP